MQFSVPRLLGAALLTLTAAASFAADGAGWLEKFDKKPADNAKPKVTASLIAENKALTPQATNRLAVVLKHEDGWHTYWRMPGDAGLPSTFSFRTPKGFKASAPLFPLPERLPTASLMSFGYGSEALFPFTVDVPRFVRFGDRVTVSVTVEFLACKDLCVPGKATAQIRLPLAVAAQPSKDAERVRDAQRMVPEVIPGDDFSAEIDADNVRIDVPERAGVVHESLDFYPLDEEAFALTELPQLVTDEGERSLYLKTTEFFATEPADRISGVLVADGGPARGGWAVETTIPLQKGSVTPPAASAAPLPPIEVPTAPPESASLGTLTALLFAFAGGLILNLMPCVFPVLSLKLLQLLEGARRGAGLVGHGVTFTGGVLATMTLLSGGLIALRAGGAALGWGFQLQSPYVVGFLALLFTAVTLNLLGLFEFTLGTRVADAKVVRETRSGLTESFLTGVLAVIVASPCTAPFMGAALGYALTQSALEALCVFLALGLGMALPWLLLCVFPQWARLLPKPGPWMETFRRAMAVPMALAVLWLLWVLSKQIDYRGVLILLCGMGAATVFFWLLGREQWGRGTNRPVMAVVAVLALLSIGFAGHPAFERTAEPVASEAGWSAWSEEAVAEGLRDGRPVFVDFTAAWCVTCQANKVTALHRPEVAAAMAEAGVLKLTADWTNRNAEIASVLAKFGRSGVPLYLLYEPSGKVTVLPELLTPSVVTEALEGIGR